MVEGKFWKVKLASTFKNMLILISRRRFERKPKIEKPLTKNRSFDSASAYLVAS